MKPRRGPDGRGPWPRWVGALTGLALLAGCVTAGQGPGRAGMTPAPARPTQTLADDPVSAEISAYYQRIESDRLARGLMRTDRGADIPGPSAAQLAQNHILVALRDEHPTGATGRGGTSVLRRWEIPVRVRMEFGPSVDRGQRLGDHARVGQLVASLADATRHPVTLEPLGSVAGNFHVLVLSEAERAAAGPRLRALVPGIDDRTVRLLTELSRQTFCMVVAFSRDNTASYTEAVAIIRAEHPDLTRLSCYHEELAQGMGLPADDDSVRPSVFNDDQEFALLTGHDLLLLRLHYDPRLRPGMTESVARPLIFTIASELVAGET